MTGNPVAGLDSADTADELAAEWLSAQDVERLLRVSRSTARELIHASGAPVFRSSGGKPGGVMRVRRDAFLAWIDSQVDQPDAAS